MEGYEVTTIEDVIDEVHIFVTTTGNKDIITKDHMYQMRDQAVVCNIGHFDNEIQVNALNDDELVTKENIKPQLDRYSFPDGHQDEEVARLHLEHLGVKLTELTDEQAEYIGVSKKGPFKPEHYKY